MHAVHCFLLLLLVVSCESAYIRVRRGINPFLDSVGKRAVNPFLDSIGKRSKEEYPYEKRYFDSLAGQSLGKRSLGLSTIPLMSRNFILYY